MPNLLITNDIVQIKVFCQAAEQLSVNVFHYSITNISAGVPTDADIASDLDAKFAPLYIALMAPNASFIGVSCQIIHGQAPKPYVTSHVHTAVGTVTGDLLSRQTAGIFTKLTNAIGRANRGRCYFPFPSEADNGPTAVPVAGYIARLTNFTNLAMAPITTVGAGGTVTYAPVIFHRATGTITAINGVRLNQKWATQRRRSSYGSPNTLPVGF